MRKERETGDEIAPRLGIRHSSVFRASRKLKMYPRQGGILSPCQRQHDRRRGGVSPAPRRSNNDSPGEYSGAVLSRCLTLHNQARQRAEGL